MKCAIDEFRTSKYEKKLINEYYRLKYKKLKLVELEEDQVNVLWIQEKGSRISFLSDIINSIESKANKNSFYIKYQKFKVLEELMELYQLNNTEFKDEFFTVVKNTRKRYATITTIKRITTYFKNLPKDSQFHCDIPPYYWARMNINEWNRVTKKLKL